MNALLGLLHVGGVASGWIVVWIKRREIAELHRTRWTFHYDSRNDPTRSLGALCEVSITGAPDEDPFVYAEAIHTLIDRLERRS